jgi:hypothetical protein
LIFDIVLSLVLIITAYAIWKKNKNTYVLLKTIEAKEKNITEFVNDHKNLIEESYDFLSSLQEFWEEIDEENQFDDIKENIDLLIEEYDEYYKGFENDEEEVESKKFVEITKPFEYNFSISLN